MMDCLHPSCDTWASHRWSIDKASAISQFPGASLEEHNFRVHFPKLLVYSVIYYVKTTHEFVYRLFRHGKITIKDGYMVKY
jgi:hypothetical protein